MGMWAVSVFILSFFLQEYWFIFYRPNGIRFVASAGTTEFTKRWNPQIGDIVSFKHHGYLHASKKPKFPTLYRLRTDISWEDVVHNWKEQKITPSSGWLILFIFLKLFVFAHIEITCINSTTSAKAKAKRWQTKGLLGKWGECSQFLHPVCKGSRVQPARLEQMGDHPSRTNKAQGTLSSLSPTQNHYLSFLSRLQEFSSDFQLACPKS